MERDRSADFNPAPDIGEDRYYYPYYDLAYYNPYLNPKINLDKLRKVPSSCADLRYTGEIKNGFYIIKADQSIKIVLCDFWKEEGSAGNVLLSLFKTVGNKNLLQKIINNI